MNERKKALISQIICLLTQLMESSDESIAVDNEQSEELEMLTVKECSEMIKGLSEYSVRKLVAEGKIPFVRAGQGERGKILINKADLFSYFKQK